MNVHAVLHGFAAPGSDSDRIVFLGREATKHQLPVWRGRWRVMVVVRLKAAALEAALARRNLTKIAFARFVGLHRTHLSDLLAGRTNPGPRTRQRLLDALGGEFDDLFEIPSEAHSYSTTRGPPSSKGPLLEGSWSSGPTC